MDVPLHLVVEILDRAGVPAGQHRCKVMPDHRNDGVPTLATGIGVAGPLAAIVQRDRRCDQLEMRVIAVLGVHQHLGQRHVEQSRRD